MSQVKFISDLHLGHKRILEFSPNHRKGPTTEDHDEWVVSTIAANMTKRDRLYILGDVILSNSIPLEILTRIPGDKILVRGNHDDRFTAKDFLEVFVDVLGISKYKGYWLSHAPIHPDELRGCKNIHGHVHTNSIMEKGDGLDEYDPRYINVSVEALGAMPITMQQIVNGSYQNIRAC